MSKRITAVSFISGMTFGASIAAVILSKMANPFITLLLIGLNIFATFGIVAYIAGGERK